MTVHRSRTLHLDDEAGRLRALRRYDVMDSATEEGFSELVALVRRIFGTKIAAIALIDEHRQWFKAIEGADLAETPRDIAFCNHTLRGAGAMAVPDARLDQRFLANPLVTEAPGLRCYLGVPLTTPDGYNIGTICAMDSSPRAFGPEDCALLEGIGRVAVAMLEMRQALRRDALTGARSRGGFEQEVGVVLAGNGRAVPHSLLMLDIDHFKKVNDDFGHLTGDQVLRRVAEEVARHLRPEDTLARWGGEEFAILLKGQSLQAAGEVAERVRAAVAALVLPELRGRKVTVSVGLAELQADWVMEDWIRQADDALYAAKREGRNRIAPAVCALKCGGMEEASR